MAATSRKKKKINKRPNKIQNLNYYAEKIEDPRLLRLEAKKCENND
jgi:hypothetical protein